MARKVLTSDSSNPKVFATGTEKCPIRYYKIIESHRPEKAKKTSSPFFLAINHKVWREKSVWYKVSPLGKNQIANFLPKVAQNAGLQACGKKIANHSVRKTSITRLLDAGIPENYVTQLSGHKNLQSLSSYKSASLTHQRQMSISYNTSFFSHQVQVLYTYQLFMAMAKVRSSGFPTKAVPVSAFKQCRILLYSHRQASV